MAQADDVRAAEEQDKLVLTLVRDVTASPEKVWTCLTDPDCFRVWWRENVEFDAREGGSLMEPWQDPQGRGRVTRAQVSAYHPPRGLVLVWADDDWSFDTVVSIWIEPTDRGSRVTIEHQGWESAPERERRTLMETHENGWLNHLANWATHAESLDGRHQGD